MALADEVKSRYGGSGSSFLIGLTNCFNPDAATIDDAQLTRACDDVAADFKTYAGMVMDITDATTGAQQISAAVQHVISKLKLYTGQIANAEAEVERTKNGIVAMSKTIARNRFLAKTKSGTTASDENPSGGTLRPEFDSERFVGYVPDEKPGPSSDGRQIGW